MADELCFVNESDSLLTAEQMRNMVPSPKGNPMSDTMRLMDLGQDDAAISELRALGLLEAEHWPFAWDEREAIYPKNVLRGLADKEIIPRRWAEEDYARYATDLRALPVLLRNPKAIVEAENILNTQLDRVGGKYVGVREWYTLCASTAGAGYGNLLPGDEDPGFSKFHTVSYRADLPQEWLDLTRDTGTQWGHPLPCLWSCVYQVHGGPSWVRDLYKTGCGLWCWKADWDEPQWVLVVRRPTTDFPHGFAMPKIG